MKRMTSVMSRPEDEPTAVVNAHGAERCGGKGCRTFVHESVDADLTTAGVAESLMPLPRALGGVSTDVCYLPRDAYIYEMDLREGRKRTVDQDLLIIRHVEHMMRQSDPMDEKVRIHYVDTRGAID